MKGVKLLSNGSFVYEPKRMMTEHYPNYHPNKKDQKSIVTVKMPYLQHIQWLNKMPITLEIAFGWQFIEAQTANSLNT